MKVKLSEYQGQDEAGCEAKDKASFTERRLFYLNYRSHRHCEEGVPPDEAISAMAWEIASGKNKYALAMTIYKGLQ